MNGISQISGPLADENYSKGRISPENTSRACPQRTDVARQLKKVAEYDSFASWNIRPSSATNSRSPRTVVRSASMSRSNSKKWPSPILFAFWNSQPSSATNSRSPRTVCLAAAHRCLAPIRKSRRVLFFFRPGIVNHPAQPTAARPGRFTVQKKSHPRACPFFTEGKRRLEPNARWRNLVLPTGDPHFRHGPSVDKQTIAYP
ncbi:hypothetical protein B0H19DRAFT_676902 [Mycena capillaripes]|nr:hypothetical protein B0H19DRAFT_676902 [Mycena capillaripes]